MEDKSSRGCIGKEGWCIVEGTGRCSVQGSQYCRNEQRRPLRPGRMNQEKSEMLKGECGIPGPVQQGTVNRVDGLR